MQCSAAWPQVQGSLAVGTAGILGDRLSGFREGGSVGKRRSAAALFVLRSLDQQQSPWEKGRTASLGLRRGAGQPSERVNCLVQARRKNVPECADTDKQTAVSP
jgi:hypothetical protein